MAVNWDLLKARYEGESQAAQMDGLAWNFLRLQVLADSGTDELVAQHLVRESQLFIEWAVSGLNLENDIAFATELVDLQRLLSQWKLRWSELWSSDQERQKMAVTAREWGDRLQGKSEAMTG